MDHVNGNRNYFSWGMWGSPRIFAGNSAKNYRNSRTSPRRTLRDSNPSIFKRIILMRFSHFYDSIIPRIVMMFDIKHV
jgi:hypothetical protein